MRVSLLLVAAFPLPLGARFLFAATPGAAGGGRGSGGGGGGGGCETCWTAEEAETGGMTARGTGEEAEAPARMERTEPTGHARQPRSWRSRLTSSVESAAATTVARGGGAGVATLALTVERRGRRRSSELSASTIADCAR
jgi:hypothetical protein